MKDLLIVIVLLAILCAAAFYIYRAKKSGKKCIGCPDGDRCAKNGGCCGKE